MQKPRKPGDQAPPPRPTHRNPGRTAPTHVTTTNGRYYVHDGDGNVLTIDGVRGENLTRDEARKFKDVAVVKHKYRRAGIKEHEYAEADEGAQVLDTPSGAQMIVDGSFVPADAPPNPDPYVEQARQKAVAAARPVAVAAQQRHEAKKVTPAAPPKPGGKPVQRAPGWEPPPPGVTQARKAPPPAAKNAPVIRGAGWELPTGGAKSEAPEAAELVSVDPIPDGDDNLAIEPVADELTELIGGGGDLEAEVKRSNTEAENKVIEKCKALRPGDVVYYFPDDTNAEYAAVVEIHATTCVTLQLGVADDTIEVTKTETDPPQDKVTLRAPATGAILKAVMLCPKEGKRGNTWQPVM